MKILIVGAGAVGGYFGGMLAKAGENVTFLARGEHLKAIQEKGLYIKSINGDFNIKIKAVERPDDNEKYDLIIIAVKSYDLPDACNNIKGTVKNDTVLMSLLNGVDSEEIIGSIFGIEKVIGSVAFIGSQILEVGVISHTASGMITIGELDNPLNPLLLRGTEGRCEKILKIFERAKIPIKISENIQKDIWAKMLWNTGFNAITALTGSLVSDVLSIPESRKIVEMTMKETVEVANKKGIRLSDDIVEKTVSKTLKAGEIKTSMLQDRENGKAMEIDSINGAIVRLGHEMNITVPVNETLYGALKVINKRLGNS
ncbi:MAG: 2-dehydropantoate 2-reductase [Nitrospinae bacterium]|nr:2-dehydropantoate 2-reductase [Nitrospinota bacterium]